MFLFLILIMFIFEKYKIFNNYPGICEYFSSEITSVRYSFNPVLIRENNYGSCDYNLISSVRDEHFTETFVI